MALHARYVSVAAHVLGSTAALVWVVSGAASLLSGDVTGDQLPTAVALAVLVVANVAGVVLARHNERRGGFVLIIAGLALGLFALCAAARNEVLSAVLGGGPFITSGLLLLWGSTLRS
jgi:hypothetical protein